MNITLQPAPHLIQKQVLDSCSPASPNRYTIVNAGRQGGKSTTAKHQAIYWALMNPKSLIWYVMPREGQCIDVWTSIVEALSASNLIKSRKASSGKIEITFTNGSKIAFKSGESGGLRGATVNFLILDEAAYLNKEVVQSDIMPTLTAGGKNVKVLICSTPCGKNWFFEYYLMGLDPNNTNYKSFTFLSTDNPSANIEEIEEARKVLPDAIFKQEYEAQFVDGASVFQNVYELCSIKTRLSAPEPGKRYYCGIDIGLVTDETVVTLIDNNGDMAYQDRFTGIAAPDAVKRIVATLKLWKPIKTWIEENNQGLTILDYVKKQYKNVEGFKTTNKSKEEIINRLIAAFSGKNIRCFDDKDIKTQLEAFVFKFTKTRKISYQAAYGHDDIVMSLALAWCLYVETKLSGGYYVGSAGVNNIVKGSNFKTNIYLEGHKDNYNGDENQEYIFFK